VLHAQYLFVQDRAVLRRFGLLSLLPPSPVLVSRVCDQRGAQSFNGGVSARVERKLRLAIRGVSVQATNETGEREGVNVLKQEQPSGPLFESSSADKSLALQFLLQALEPHCLQLLGRAKALESPTKEVNHQPFHTKRL